MDYQGTEFLTEDFTIEETDEVKNGGNIKVELTEDGITKYRELYGENPIQTSRLYEVNVPEYYASKSSDICVASLEKMKQQAEDAHASIRSVWDLESTQFQSITYIGNYFLESKGDADSQNKLYLLYEIKVRNTAENSLKEQKYDKVHTHYWYLCYSDIYVNKDGVVQSSIYDGYEKPSDRFDVDSEVWTGSRLWADTYEWEYIGYKSREELRQATVDQNAEKYKVEENLINTEE